MKPADAHTPSNSSPLLSVAQLDITTLLASLSDALAHELKTLEEPQLVGIATGGVWLAQWLHQKLQLPGDVAELDSSFHRDDFGLQGHVQRFGVSSMPESLEGKDIVLVDDVLHTGRTVRAALNSLFEYGRPRQVKLLVLADRVGRELPMQADISACRIDLSSMQRLRLTQTNDGVTPLQIVIEEVDK